MNHLIEKSNLNFNSWLINWGLMKGYLIDGMIEATKFGFSNQYFGFLLNLVTLIKWTIQLFSTKDSKISHQLGNWGPFLGPKVIIELIIIFGAIYVLSVFLLFYFCSKHPKNMFYWLFTLAYDLEHQCFNQLNLNQTGSKSFKKSISLLKFTLNGFIYSFIPLFIIANSYSVFVYQNDYHVNYLISILQYSFQLYYNINLMFGLPVILYQVNVN